MCALKHVTLRFKGPSPFRCSSTSPTEESTMMPSEASEIPSWCSMADSSLILLSAPVIQPFSAPGLSPDSHAVTTQTNGLTLTSAPRRWARSWPPRCWPSWSQAWSPQLSHLLTTLYRCTNKPRFKVRVLL